MKIIPAIDVIAGKCVRLIQGNYSQCKIYSESPLQVARIFEEAGATRLHLVDLEGAKSAGVVNIRVLEEICRETSLEVDFGGGIKTARDLQQVFNAGAKYACLGSIAQSDVEQTRIWLKEYGGERIIIGADVWNTKICIHGWKKVTDTTIVDLIRNYEGELRHLMCTDIRKDGTLQGPGLELYQDLSERYPALELIASGGVGSMEDIRQLAETKVSAVIVGKAIYEKKVGLEMLNQKTLEEWLKAG